MAGRVLLVLLMLGLLQTSLVLAAEDAHALEEPSSDEDKAISDGDKAISDEDEAISDGDEAISDEDEATSDGDEASFQLFNPDDPDDQLLLDSDESSPRVKRATCTRRRIWHYFGRSCRFYCCNSAHRRYKIYKVGGRYKLKFVGYKLRGCLKSQTRYYSTCPRRRG